MDNHYVIYQKGLANSIELFIRQGKICVRENSYSGEHLYYVEPNSELRLLWKLDPPPWWVRFLVRHHYKNEAESLKVKTLRTLAKKFEGREVDPLPGMMDFFRRNNIEYASEYWPDSDRF